MFKLNFKKFTLVFLFLLLSSGVFFSFSPQAQALQISDYPSFLNIRAGMSLTELVSSIFSFILIIAGLATFVMIVFGGFRYLTSAGDPSKMGDARGQIFAAILGLVIVFSSWMILNTINPQLVELKEPGVPDAPVVGDIPVPVVAGTCVEGKTHAVELYSKSNYRPSEEPAKCYDAGQSARFFNENPRSIKLNDGLAIRLYNEPGFTGKNICFISSQSDLKNCNIGCYSWIPSFLCRDTWTGDVKSLKIISLGACSFPEKTLGSGGISEDPNAICK